MDRQHVAAASIMTRAFLQRVQWGGQRSEFTRAPTRSPRRGGRSRWRVGNVTRQKLDHRPETRGSDLWRITPRPPSRSSPALRIPRIYGTPTCTRNDRLAVPLPSTTRLNIRVSRSWASPLKVTTDPVAAPGHHAPTTAAPAPVDEAPVSTPPPTQR